ncbi:UNKNOWN [Stylonychia lemnae]|uniref:Uncharacterized protein n=1 Tax=Stylonychia lemnae TaxID=5949 RepID=A0A077ZXY3_STYLE|nr:UNKNOWN [Stylonychia lemnae]|eukprot:CDW74766.1 UNKNOWN [Stylonychia lemnae]
MQNYIIKEETKENIFVIRSLKSKEEVDLALNLRANEFLKLEEYKTLKEEDMISEFEKQTAYRIYEYGHTFAAFDGEQLMSYYFTYDLTFEPFADVDKLNLQQQVIRNMRLDAVELLKPQPGQYWYVGYTTTKHEYRRNKLCFFYCQFTYAKTGISIRCPSNKVLWSCRLERQEKILFWRR